MKQSTYNELQLQTAEASYEPRVQLLKDLARQLEEETITALKHIPRIDRVSFRVKEPNSFAKKSLKLLADGSPRYSIPLADIEDQVGGRILVLLRRDIDSVIEKLLKTFNRVEQIRKAPTSPKSFAYESDHLVFMIPPHVAPMGWDELHWRPTTFEMQVRTLFMHAWAETEHDISYKAKVELTHEEQRKIAWAASNAWGGDAIFEQVVDSIAARTSSGVDRPI